MKRGTHLARALRQNQTEAEARLWSRLRDRRLNGWKFRRQVPVERFVVDFLCRDAGVVIELDGSHHQQQCAYDQERTQVLEACGYHVLRFWNADVLQRTDNVLETILSVIETR